MQTILESLTKQREQILQDSSEEMLNRHTSLLEIAIISLYNRLVNRLDVGKEQMQFRSNAAVVALGALGGGIIGPYEDVQILFLTSESLPWKESWSDEIDIPLREAGWSLSSQQVNLKDLTEHAHDDFPFFLSLLEARYISGNRKLLEELDEVLESLIDQNRDAFLRHLCEMTEEKRKGDSDPINWLEPDLIQDPGSLGDILVIRQACRIISDIRNLDDAIFHGYLVREEVDTLRRAQKTYVLLLNLVKQLAGNGTGKLRFEEQEKLAEKLAYSAPSGFLPVEAFMKHIHQLLHEVAFITQEFWERVQGSRWEWESREEAPPVELEKGIILQGGRISIQPAHYSPTPSRLVHLFVLAAQHKAQFDNNTRRWIQHHRNLLNTAAEDPAVKSEITELIRSDTPDLPCLRRFYNMGILTALIPELWGVHGLVQHDLFHIYPVHEHHLRTLTELKRLIEGRYAREEPELTRIAGRIEQPSFLYWASLLHDIGKAVGQDHALHGGEMIPAIAKRLGFTPEEADTVQFLVAHHPLLRESASMRYLGDEEMLARCSLLIGNLERLDLLLLLSFADMSATGPNAMEKWHQTSIMPLFNKIQQRLEKGEPSPQAIEERIIRLKELVLEKVQDLMGIDELEQHFAQWPPRYLLSMSPGEIERHLRLEWRFAHSRDLFACEVSTEGSVATLTFTSNETPGLLAQVAGVLALHDLNIVEAQIFTKKNGTILLIFQCSMPDQKDHEPDWEMVIEDMKRLLQGKLALEYRVAVHAARRTGIQSPLRSSPTQILIDNDSSEVYTILEIYTIDRVGLLYSITRTLLDLQLRIHVAKITTKGDQVADVFYLKSHRGKKITDPEQMEEIKNALNFWLETPQRR